MYSNQPFKIGTTQKKKEVYKARLDEAKSVYKSKPSIKLNAKDNNRGDLEGGIIYSSQDLGVIRSSSPSPVKELNKSIFGSKYEKSIN